MTAGGVAGGELESGDETPRESEFWRFALLIVGLVLVVLCLTSIILAWTEGSKTSKTTPSTLTATISHTTTTNGSGSKPSSSNSTTKTIADGGPLVETTNSPPSEGLLLGTLGMGLILVLVAAFYWRIKSIAFPGGAGLVLSDKERAQIVEKVADIARPGADPADIAQATLVALELAQANKLSEKGHLPEKAIERAVEKGLATTGMASTPTRAGTRSRLFNVVLGPRSAAHKATRPLTTVAGDGAESTPPPASSESASAPASVPRADWNLIAGAGRTIADLVFVNRYVGEQDAWAHSDIANIDRALEAAMSDQTLQSVIAQYYVGSITSRMLPSKQVRMFLPATVYKDTVEQLVSELHAEGVLAGEDPASSVINVMLPEGVLLSDDFSAGFQPPAGSESAYLRRKEATIKLEDGDAAGSRDGLAGYHGSVHLGGGMTIYYAVGVYSKGDNGIVAFEEPWKNVVATFYHELNEVRTDPDVEDVNRTGDEAWLGWYSQQGQGEIGDLPINSCGGDVSLIFKEVPLADGSGVVPIQLMWSNQADGPAESA